MDEKDRLLLTLLQNGLPLTPRPFDVWAAKIETDNADLLVRIQRLKREGLLGGIKAVLDPRAFHYQSAWVAIKLSGSPEPAFATEALWQHPGVIYGCEREHEFNVWFFIAVPADQDLELHVRCLERLATSRATLLLPVRQVFKGTDLLSSLDAGTFPVTDEHFEKRKKTHSSDLTSEEIEMIQRLQEPFPFTDEPYRKIAADLGVTETQALERMRSLVAKGCLKRIGSFSQPIARMGQERHLSPNATSTSCGNVEISNRSQTPAEAVLKDRSSAAVPGTRMLVVWQIPEEKLEQIGSVIAEFHEVLHADRRPAYPEFPYALYTMIQAATPAELEVAIKHIQDRVGKWPHRALATVREFKRRGMKYFPKELDAWWRQNRLIAEATYH